jgi:hypothetical protein
VNRFWRAYFIANADRRTARHLGSRVANTAHTFVAESRFMKKPRFAAAGENPELG